MINRNEMRIIVDNLDEDIQGNIVHTRSDIIDFVTQYRFQGGPEQPIRYLEMKVNKNDIDNAYGDLIDTIVEGKTRLIIDAVDGGTFIITKLWLNDNLYEIVATGIEVTLNTATLSEEWKNYPDGSKLVDLRPPKIVEKIFNDWVSTLNLSEDDGFRLYFSESFENGGDYTHQIDFKRDMPTLVAINMCALIENAFVFFAGRDWVEDGRTVHRNTLHFVSYEDITPLAHNPGNPSLDGVVNIYPKMNSPDAEYSMFDLMMFEKLIGISSKNSEGSETIINNQNVSVDGASVEFNSNNSIGMYGDYAGAEVRTDRIIANPEVAGLIAENIVRRYKDPTRSITFSMSEAETTDYGTGWEGSIPVFSYARKIHDSVNNITLVNEHLCEPVGRSERVDNFMLRLSTFIRYYPEFTTEYTFGVMKETTLSQELANKLSSISGNLTDLRLENGDSIADDTGIIRVDSEPNPTPPGDNPHLVTSAGVDSALKEMGLAVETALKTIGLAMYPVGSIYLSVNNVNPTNLFGGTWVSFGAGRVPVGVDTSHGAEGTGGSSSITLSTDNLPAHTHNVSGSTGTESQGHTHNFNWSGSHSHSTSFAGTRQCSMSSGASMMGRYSSQMDSGTAFSIGTDSQTISIDKNTEGESATHTHSFNVDSSSVGNGTAFSVEQPWIGVYMWKRTA